MTRSKTSKRYLFGLGAGLITASAFLLSVQALAIYLLLVYMVKVQISYIATLGLLLIWKIMTIGMGPTYQRPSKPVE